MLPRAIPIRPALEALCSRVVPAFGDLDTSFSSDGILPVNFLNGETAFDAALLSDGSTIIVGGPDPSSKSSGNIVASRILADGTFDLAFGNKGILSIDLANFDSAQAVTVQNDGKILIAGISGLSGTFTDKIVVARLNTDFSPDVTFGTGGIATINFGGGRHDVSSILVSADGTITVAGTFQSTIDSDLAFARLTGSGSLDPTFDGDGLLTINFGNAEQADDLIRLADGSYVATGTTGSPRASLVILKFSSTGVPDTNFGTGGKTLFSAPPSGSIFGRALVGATDGSIFAVGEFFPDASSQVRTAVVKVSANGQPDLSFSGDGFAELDLGNDSFGSDIHLLIDGRLVVFSTINAVGDDPTVALAVVTTNGTLDTSINKTGVINYNLKTSDSSRRFAVGVDGKAILVTDTKILRVLDIRGVPPVIPTDVVVTITDNRPAVLANDKITYAILVSNTGPAAAANVNVTLTIPSFLSGLTFTSTSVNGATGNIVSGTGTLNELLVLPSGSSVTYLVTGKLSLNANALGPLIVTATATFADDSAPGNNTVSDSNVVAAALFLPTTAVGPDVGSSGPVRVLNNQGTTTRTIPNPLGDPAALVGVRTAMGDVTGDGMADVIVGAGPGGGPLVVIFDGATGDQVAAFFAFETTFTGGIYVSAADFNMDGRADLVISPDLGGGPRVRVLSGLDLTVIRDFFGIEDAGFRGGARVGVGDVNGDGIPDLLVGAGFGGGPRVAVFDGSRLRETGEGGLPPKLFGDFFAFEDTVRDGVYLSAGDLDGDGRWEVIAGGGPNGGPRVSSFLALDLLNSNGQTRTPRANFFSGDSNLRGGVRVLVRDLDNDFLADIVTGAGERAGGTVRAYAGISTAANGEPPSLFTVEPIPGLTAGIFVG